MGQLVQVCRRGDYFHPIRPGLHPRTELCDTGQDQLNDVRPVTSHGLDHDPTVQVGLKPGSLRNLYPERFDSVV